MLGPVSFVIAALIVYWSGWNTVSWLLGLQILMFVVYVLWKRCRTRDRQPAAGGVLLAVADRLSTR